MSIKSSRLNKGDTIAIVSPSWGGPNIFPHIYQTGINILTNLGYNIKEYPSTKKEEDFLHNNPKFRAEDINRAFADKTTKAIFTTIGGDDSIRILQYLDKKTIINNPKIFMGFSDITIINTYLNQLGLVTFNGPSIMAGLSQWDDLGKEFQESFIDFFENEGNYKYNSFPFYCNGYLDWGDMKNTGKTKEKITNEGWRILQGKGSFSGKLFGGCIEVLEFLKGTPYYPEQDFWKNKIFFLEISGDTGIQITRIRRIIRNYAIAGVFDKISGLLIGRARNYTKKDKEKLNDVILDVINKEFGITELPIITNMDFGHTDPQWILPLGINAKFDIDKKTFELTESCFI